MTNDIQFVLCSMNSLVISDFLVDTVTLTALAHHFCELILIHFSSV